MTTRRSLRHDSPSRRQLRRRATVLWAAALLLAFSLIPLYLVYLGIEHDADRLDADYQIVQRTLTAMGTPDPEKQALKQELTQVQRAIALVKGASSELEDQNVDWPAVMDAIERYNPIQLTLDSVRQVEGRIILEGHAVDDTVVIAYSNRLEENALFAEVTVQSLKAVATPFVTPSSTPMEPLEPTETGTPTITPTPTPDPSDPYEVDDFEPQPIFLNQVQTHNFYPIHDVDQLTFLAKAGRYYRVSTFDLALGVDTFLTVIVDDETYTNDDREPGELGSEVTFQAPEGKETDVRIQITNHRHYGPEKEYSVVIEEFVPTITPTPTETPTPSSTPTPTLTPEPPTSTPSPATDTPTPTATAPTSTPTSTLIPTLTPTSTLTVTPTSESTGTSRLPGLAVRLLGPDDSLAGELRSAPAAQAIRFVIVVELAQGAQ